MHVETLSVARGVVNPRRAFAARVTIVGVSVCLSETIYAPQATLWYESDTNSFSATSARKVNEAFCRNDRIRDRETGTLLTTLPGPTHQLVVRTCVYVILYAHLCVFTR